LFGVHVRIDATEHIANIIANIVTKNS
jgi:hypothetical protein